VDACLRHSLVEGDFGPLAGLRLSLAEGDFYAPRDDEGVVIFGPAAHPDEIDYDKPAGSRRGDGLAPLAATPPAGGGKLYYAALAVSRLGRLDLNRHVIVEADFDAEGELAGRRPAAPCEAEARPAAAGRLEVRWAWTPGRGAAAASFVVYADGEPVGTAVARGAGAYRALTTALTDGVEYEVRVRALAADEALSEPSNAARCRADATPPAAAAVLAAETVL